MLIIVGRKKWNATIKQIINYEKKLAKLEEKLEKSEEENRLLKKNAQNGKNLQ